MSLCRETRIKNVAGRRGMARLDIQLLSGRTGLAIVVRGYARRKCGGERCGIGAVVSASSGRARRAPDLIAGYVGQVTKPAGVRFDAGTVRLVRISGRDGKVVWDMPVAGDRSGHFLYRGTPWTFFDDFDGDGALDLALFSPVPLQSGVSYALLAVSLHDGRLLWIGSSSPVSRSPTIPISKLEGPDGPALVVMEGADTDGGPELIVRAFGGRDGQPRWTTKLGKFPGSDGSQSIVAANFGGTGKHEVCVSLGWPVDDGRSWFLMQMVKSVSPGGQGDGARMRLRRRM